MDGLSARVCVTVPEKARRIHLGLYEPWTTTASLVVSWFSSVLCSVWKRYDDNAVRFVAMCLMLTYSPLLITKIKTNKICENEIKSDKT